jgi:PAS domain S-box-containing protein
MDDSILAAFLRGCSHLIVVTDPSGHIEWVNSAFERTTGYTLAEVRGRRPGSFLNGPQTDAQAMARLDEAHRAVLPVHGLELAHYKRDGSVYWIELELLPLRDAGGAVTHWVGLQDDITEWKRAQSSFRSSERLLNEAAEIAHVGAWDLDAATHELRWSNHTYAIHEVDAGTPVDAEYAFSFYTPASQSLMRAAVDRALAEGEPYDVEVELITARGQRRWARAIGNAELRGGRVVRIAGTFQDVTERHQAREQIAELAERLRLATDASGIGVWERALPDGDLTWNQHMFRLYDLEAEAPRPGAELWQERLHPEDRARVVATLQSLRDGTRNVYEIEYRIVLGNGELRHLRSVSRRFETAGRAKLIGTVIDITELKRSEQARMEKEAAERANRAKSEFLSRVSHELRTPLNGVLGFAQLLALDATSLTAAQREQIGHLKRAGEHLLQIVNDMLDLASIEAGAMRLVPEAVMLGDVVEDAAALVRTMADERGISLQLLPPQDTGLSVLADRTRLRQVLVNLLSNAVKYNRLQGNVRVSWKQEGNLGCLRVRDTGLGLKPQELAQLFQPFNRLGAEATTIGGTGLGLSITRRLMEAMGGQIDVSSTPGMGTQFRLSLPLAPPPLALPLAPGAPVAPAAAATPRRLLFYVEDNPTNVLLLKHALGLLGPQYRLEVATDGEQALARLATLRPDLVLLDINLPGISGYEVLRQLDSVMNSSRPPCVAVSADAMPEELARAREAGFDDYWTKPLDLTTLGERIEALLRARLA